MVASAGLVWNDRKPVRPVRPKIAMAMTPDASSQIPKSMAPASKPAVERGRLDPRRVEHGDQFVVLVVRDADGVGRRAAFAEGDAVCADRAGLTQPRAAGAAARRRLTVGVDRTRDLALHPGGVQRLLAPDALVVLVLVQRSALRADHRGLTPSEARAREGTQGCC
jgi:hypothetical protein